MLRGKSLFQHLGTIPLNKTLHHLNYPSLLAGCYSVKPIRLINKFVNQVGCPRSGRIPKSGHPPALFHGGQLAVNPLGTEGLLFIYFFLLTQKNSVKLAEDM